MPEFLKTIPVKILVPLIFLLSGCYTSYVVISQNYNYDNDIVFTIDKVQEGTNISTGNRNYYVASGNKFVFLHTTFKNNSAQKKKLDFEKFVLIEPESQRRYKVDFAMLESAFVVFGKVDSEIDKNDTKRRVLVFTFPKTERAEMLEVDGTIYNIQYADKPL